MQEYINALHKAAAIHGTERKNTKNRNQNTAQNQTDSVNGVGQRNRFQTAADCVERPYDCRCDTYNGNCPETRLCQLHAELLRHDNINAKNVDEHLRTCIQYIGQHNQNIGQQHNERNQTAGSRIVALFKELRNRSQSGFQILWHEHKRQNDQRNGRSNLPAHRTHTNTHRLSIHTNQLLGRQIGHQQRAGDDWTCQSTASQIVAVLCVQLIVSRFPPRNKRNKCSERHKCYHGEH